jgi:hypothetical protein
MDDTSEPFVLHTRSPSSRPARRRRTDPSRTIDYHGSQPGVTDIRVRVPPSHAPLWNEVKAHLNVDNVGLLRHFLDEYGNHVRGCITSRELASPPLTDVAGSTELGSVELSLESFPGAFPNSGPNTGHSSASAGQSQSTTSTPLPLQLNTIPAPDSVEFVVGLGNEDDIDFLLGLVSCTCQKFIETLHLRIFVYVYRLVLCFIAFLKPELFFSCMRMLHLTTTMLWRSLLILTM